MLSTVETVDLVDVFLSNFFFLSLSLCVLCLVPVFCVFVSLCPSLSVNEKCLSALSVCVSPNLECETALYLIPGNMSAYPPSLSTSYYCILYTIPVYTQ